MPDKFIPIQFQYGFYEISNCIGSIEECDSLEQAIQFAKSHRLQISKTWIIFKKDSSKAIPIKYLDINKNLEFDLI